MRRKIIPAHCRRCLARRKEAEAKKWEASFRALVKLPAPPLIPWPRRIFSTIFKQIGWSR